MSLDKPVGTEPFARSTVNGNMDDIDKNLISFAFAGIPAVAYSKGAMVFDGSGNPQSQTISGPNGLTGSITWSFTASTITTTLSITAPTTFSVVNTLTIATLAETTTIS